MLVWVMHLLKVLFLVPPHTPIKVLKDCCQRSKWSSYGNIWTWKAAYHPQEAQTFVQYLPIFKAKWQFMMPCLFKTIKILMSL